MVQVLERHARILRSVRRQRQHRSADNCRLGLPAESLRSNGRLWPLPAKHRSALQRIRGLRTSLRTRPAVWQRREWRRKRDCRRMAHQFELHLPQRICSNHFRQQRYLGYRRILHSCGLRPGSSCACPDGVQPGEPRRYLPESRCRYYSCDRNIRQLRLSAPSMVPDSKLPTSAWPRTSRLPKGNRSSSGLIW